MLQISLFILYVLRSNLQALATPAACEEDTCESFGHNTKTPGLLQAHRQLADQGDFADVEEVEFVPEEKDADAGTMNSTIEHIQHLAEYAQQVFQGKDSELVAKAKKVEQLAETGANLSKHIALIMEVIQPLAAVLTPAAAAEAGAELSVDDISNLVHSTDKMGHAVSLEETNSTCFQGDMCPDSVEQLASFVQLTEDGKSGKSYGTGKPWHKGVVTYCFDKDVTKNVKKAVGYAIQQFNKVLPCLEFKKVNYKADGQCAFGPALFFQSRPLGGCWSMIGMLEPGDGKAQRIQLQSPGCDSVGTTIHEILHALGMSHEQSRPDRDAYVTIKWGNIQKGKKHNFAMAANGDTNRPYDILSIMHYGLTDFGAGKATIATKAPAYAQYTKKRSQFKHYVPGDRIGMAQSDAEQLADHYAGQISCSASKLSRDKKCTDLKKNGKAWKDLYGWSCQKYVKWQKQKKGRDCSKYIAGSYCCDCGGGLRLQHWEKTQPSGQIQVVAPAHPTGDSKTYKDPFYRDTCAGWTKYSCHGFAFSAELYTQCPSACKCADSGARFNGLSCDSWKKRKDGDWCGVGFAKPGGNRRRGWGIAVAKHCAATCGLCPGIVTTTTTTTTVTVDATSLASCKDSKTYKDPHFGLSCANWGGYRCTGYHFSKKLLAACPQACRSHPDHCCYDNKFFTMAGKQGCAPWKKSDCQNWRYKAGLEKFCPVFCDACPAGKVAVPS